MSSSDSSKSYDRPSTSSSHLSSFDPVAIGINNFISGIFPNEAAESSSWCRNCENDSAFSECMDCRMPLCDPCAKIHLRHYTTQDHTISRIFRSTSQIRTPPRLRVYNSHHRQLYNHSCTSPLCIECSVLSNTEPQSIFTDQLVEITQARNQNVRAEAAETIRGIGETIEHIGRKTTTLDLTSLIATTEAKNCIKGCIVELQKRELELTNAIDHASQIKIKHLLSQIENLQKMFTQLEGSFQLINESKKCNNVFELMTINEKLRNDLRRVYDLKDLLIPCEEDNIRFIPPGKDFCSAISKIGNLSPYSSIQQRLDEVEMEELFPSSRNRCIYGIDAIEVIKRVSLPIFNFGNEEVNVESNDGKLCRPWGICCDHVGNFFLADRSNDRIQVYNSLGNFLYKFGSHGNAPGQFNRPAGISLSPKGHIVVVDKDNHRIQVFKIDGTFVRTFGEWGQRNGQFCYPWDVSCNAQGNIVVTDSRNHRIQLFNEEGTFLAQFGFKAYRTKEFDAPRGVCFHPCGDIIVSDFNNHRLAIIDPFLMNVNYLGQGGNGNGQFFRPQGVVCDDKGNIIIVDTRNHRIQVITMKGKFLWGFGANGKKTGELDSPCDVCLTPGGRIAVVDFGNNRVQVF